MKTFYLRLSRSHIAQEMRKEAGGAVVRPEVVNAAFKNVIDNTRLVADMQSDFPKGTFEKLEDEHGVVIFEKVSVGIAGSGNTPSGAFVIFTTAGFNVVFLEVD